ncbi:MAG TPA: hypothetical protein VGY99_27620 [Candidatus Binataceae bacterium]|nr:hypothetical protein [Candidatus Binataceae bacterium]
MENLARLLKEHPFLRGIEDLHLEFLTGCASNARYAAGEFLFKEGRSPTRPTWCAAGASRWRLASPAAVQSRFRQ